MRAKFTIAICTLLGFVPICRGAMADQEQVRYQRDSLTTKPIYFRIGSDAVDPEFDQNAGALKELGALLTDTVILARMDSVRITATSSPDGNPASNRTLAAMRAQSVKDYIGRNYPRIEQHKVITESSVESWQQLRFMLSSDAPYYKQIIAILDRNEAPQATESLLRSIDNGKAWAQIMGNELPAMRSGATCVVYTSRIITPAPATKVPEPKPQIETPMPTPVVEQEVVFFVAEPTRRPLFALKTNLLYDAFTALNIEVEVPIGPRWSIAGEYIFPWWLCSRKQHCLQSLSGYIEGRYRFGDRTQHRQLTGWFAGLYAGAGYYDVEWDHKGYQGEFFIPLALSGGYAHSIGRNLSMEYSLGIGYMQTNYRHYRAGICPDGELRLIRQNSGTYRWFGPTRLKVSLVWMINTKTRR